MNRLKFSKNDLEMIERILVLMYGRTSPLASVNKCGRILYTKKQRTVECIPPTQDSLVQHIKRTTLKIVSKSTILFYNYFQEKVCQQLTFHKYKKV